LGLSGIPLLFGKFGFSFGSASVGSVTTPHSFNSTDHSTGDVLAQHNNNERVGSYMQPGLNQSTFSPQRDWGLKGTICVKGAVYAQPLYVENLPIGANGSLADVVFIATAQNCVYAFDTDSLQQYWMCALGQADDTDQAHVDQVYPNDPGKLGTVPLG
jgi:hypothetical protein